MPFSGAPTNSTSSKYPRNAREQEIKSTARRRYTVVAIAAVVATALFLYAVNDAKRRATEEAVQMELARLQTVSLEAARQIEAFFDQRFAVLEGFAGELLAVSGDQEAANRLAVALFEEDEDVLSAAYAVGNVYGTAERTNEGVVVSRDLFRARGDTTQSISDAYEKPSDELDHYIGQMLGAMLNPSPYGSAYATLPPPKPLMAAEISISFDREGLAWMELSLRDVDEICDDLRGAYYTAPLLLTHDDTPVLPAKPEERAVSELMIFLEVGSERSGIMGAEYGYLRSIFAASDAHIGDTGETWEIAFHSPYDSVAYAIRDEYEKIRVIGIFVIFLVAAAAAVFVKTREVAARPKTAEPDTSPAGFTADPAFMERTKGLRQQRFACRLICALFFLPALLFTAKREKAFEAAIKEGDEEGMKAAVAGMWPAAVAALLLGLAILWANFALDLR